MDANTIELNQLLLKFFPELLEKYHDEVDWQEGDKTGSHVVYGDVFAPYVEHIIDEQADEKLKHIFNFIEEILSKNEKYSSEVILFSVLERLVTDKKRLQICKKYLGSFTQNAINELP